ncbi:hypothetical protein PMAYCL1PPCAC_13034 [Pristionchus mayeri]|uniref:[histone H3]-lysine(4) N-trimethyltransferase n=1 Tax=Pristionchus mayeri TaxID=1317129 RepID=A0AAN4ZP28_9BILA|nr:hypothetical protein PMAYCL1PPCAC_13034 [Pristionchus mayeri]
MASRNFHSGDSRPGPSKDPESSERRNTPMKHGNKSSGAHPNELSCGGYYSRPTSKSSTDCRLYKVMYDPSYMTHIKTKDFVRRYNGKCGEKYKQFDYPQSPKDPRVQYRKIEQPKDLKIPNLTVDDQYIGIPPKREVTISNLNDNVNEKFLRDMTNNQKLTPEEVIVFHHPGTRKHLTMALILFKNSKSARLFVEANNEASLMGQPISCRLDPFAAELSAMYTKMVNEPLPTLKYLSGMSEHELSLRREKITGGTAVAASQEGAAAAVGVPANDGRMEKEKSLSPMDTSNSPQMEAAPSPPPIEQEWHHPPPQPTFYDVAGASTSKMPSPPPPYSELPPSNHSFDQRRSESRKHSAEPEGRSRRDKRRHSSTSSSSSYSSGGEGHSSRHRSEGGVKKKRTKEEYLKVKRYVSSERDSNGGKHILKEVKTVTYKRRTEQRIGQKVSPDSFDEEMKRRERSMSKGKRSAERGRDEMRWTPSSDSDEGGSSRRKKNKDRASESHAKEEERKPPPPATPHTPTPSLAPSVAGTPSSSRRSGFHSAPHFDPSQPPPVIVPPVGLVLPDCSIPPPAQIPLPPMMVPPPPLPGGFIPPPEFFGLQSTPAMLSAATAAAAASIPPFPMPMTMPPLPPMMGTMGGYATPQYSSPARPPKMPSISQCGSSPAPMGSCSLAAVGISSPSMSTTGLARASSSASLSTPGRTPVTATPPNPTEGSSTPRATPATATAEKKVNLDDRLSQLFGLKKTKKEEESKEMKHASSAPSISMMAAEPRMRNDDDMEIDDDDMDVASSSSEGARGGGTMMMERREERETEEERRMREEAERRKNEELVEMITKKTLDKLVKDLEQQVSKDVQRKLETTAFQVLEDWEKRQKNEEEERKKQMIRETLASRAAARYASAATPKKDPMEEMLAAKLKSPEGLTGGISKVFSSINIVKRKNLAAPSFSRDGTPVSRDSRGQSRNKSRSASRSSRSSSNEDERRKTRTRSTTADSSESEEDEVKKDVKRRPKMRNIESSQESSGSSSSSNSSSESESSESDDEEEKENQKRKIVSPMDDDDFSLDVVGLDEDEVEKIENEVKKERLSASSGEDAGPSTPPGVAAAATAAVAEEVKKEEVEGAMDGPRPSSSAMVADSLLSGVSWSSSMPSASELARRAAQRELMQHQPSMRPDALGYDPVRYDHPYVRQLGIPAPIREGRSVQPFVTKEMARPVDATITRAIAPAVAASASVPPPSLPSSVRSTPAKKKKKEDKLPNEVLALLSSVPAPRRKPKTFPPRTREQEDRIRDCFKAGMDEEDEKYLKIALAEMQKDGARPFGIPHEVPFESHLRAYTPLELKDPVGGRLYFDDPDLDGVIPHSEGCARAQGFYRLSTKQKIRIMRRPEAFQDKTEINERDEVVTRHQVQAQKEQRSMNRRLQTMVDSNPNSEFFKVNQLKYRKKMIKFARSRIHGWGLYALEPIAPDDMIVEYIGQKIRPIVADEREKAYERRGIGSSYLFRIDEDEVIDATRQGNFARFINHSCQPNCYAKVVTVDSDKRIVIYSKSLIQKGDEITYDYKFPIEEDKIECLCGAPSCRGTLN